MAKEVDGKAGKGSLFLLVCWYCRSTIWVMTQLGALFHNHEGFGTSMRAVCWRYTRTRQGKNHSNLPIWGSLDGVFREKHRLVSIPLPG